MAYRRALQQHLEQRREAGAQEEQGTRLNQRGSSLSDLPMSPGERYSFAIAIGAAAAYFLSAGAPANFHRPSFRASPHANFP